MLEQPLDVVAIQILEQNLAAFNQPFNERASTVTVRSF
jgi:hypothetical protein